MILLASILHSSSNDLLPPAWHVDGLVSQDVPFFSRQEINQDPLEQDVFLI